MNSTNRLSALRQTSLFLSAFLATALLACSISSAQVVIDDMFADGDRSVTGMSGSDVEGAFYTSTNSNAIEDSVGSLGLVSGTSGRGIHAPFATQSLTNVGDKLVFEYSFTTPATIEAAPGESSSFRVGLFDASGVPGGVAAYATDLTSSTDALHENLLGFMMDHDVNTGSADLNFRERNAPGAGQDRLLGSTSDFSSIGSSSSPDGDYAFVGNEMYSGMVMVERVSATDVMISGSISGNGGGTTHSATYAPASFDYNLLGFHANSDNFGSTNSPDMADNGLDFSNIRVEFIPVPEPGSAILILMGSLLVGMRFRRR